MCAVGFVDDQHRGGAQIDAQVGKSLSRNIAKTSQLGIKEAHIIGEAAMSAG
jgi:hypothetical protein